MPSLKAVNVVTLPPDSGGSAKAFSRIGYDLTEAVADIIDNSLDAGASRVEVTFLRNDDHLRAVTISDNGNGMGPDELRAAMQFATPQDRDQSKLGVFGLGMKSASLSQCRSVTVLASADGSISGCRWTDESIGAGWKCEILDETEVGQAFADGYAGGKAPASGVVVLWEKLDRLSVEGGEGGLDAFLPQLLATLDLRLGLIFHRFIGPKFGIILRIKHVDRSSSLPRRVRAYDPFGYTQTGRDGFPKNYRVELPGGSLQLQAHIWPPNTASPNFLLGRRKATPHQGFYFYRNDRLIQAGGWNGLVRDATEPDLSLARVAVDLPPGVVDTNVQKSEVQTTAALAHALTAAKAGRSSISEYLDAARKTFRQGRGRPSAGAPVPIVLGQGLPVALQRASASQAGGKFTRPIDFEWQVLDVDRVFELDVAGDRILLNRTHRAALLDGAAPSGADAPLFKLMLFLLSKGELDRTRGSAKHTAWLDDCNRMLIDYVESK